MISDGLGFRKTVHFILFFVTIEISVGRSHIFTLKTCFPSKLSDFAVGGNESSSNDIFSYKSMWKFYVSLINVTI